MQYLIFDIILVLLLVLAVWRGYRKGFILTFCGFLAIFVALIGASVVSNVLSQPVSQAISPMIESSIQQAVAEKLQTPTVPGLEDSSQTEPQPPAAPDGTGSTQESAVPDVPLQDLLNLLKQSPLYRGFADALQSAVDAGLVSATANATLVISEYIAGQVARIVLFVVSFVLILILWFFVSHALDLAFKLPVLSTLNRWGGGALGLFKGALLIYIACWLLKGSFIPQEAIHNTYLLHFFCTASPLTLLS